MILSVLGKSTFSKNYLVQNKKEFKLSIQDENSDQLPHKQTDAHCMKNKFLKKVSELFFSWNTCMLDKNKKKHILAQQNLFNSKTLRLSDTCSKQKCKHY